MLKNREEQMAQDESGVTLLELLIALMFLALLMGMGVGSFKPLLQKIRLQSQAEDLLAGLFLARSEAIKRGMRVTACVSSDGMHCLSKADWDQGWLIFEDVDGNAIRADSEALIQVHAAMPPTIKASGNSPVSRYVSYAPTGRSLYVSGAFQAGTITLCAVSEQSSNAWDLVINAVGKPRLEKITGGACP
jgi:type IV fimbrial biogenesis protein FimT